MFDDRVDPTPASATSDNHNPGDLMETYDDLEFSLNGRFGRGGMLSGCVSTSKRHTKACSVVDSPQQLYQCDQAVPWRHCVGGEQRVRPSPAAADADRGRFIKVGAQINF